MKQRSFLVWYLAVSLVLMGGLSQQAFAVDEDLAALDVGDMGMDDGDDFDLAGLEDTVGIGDANDDLLAQVETSAAQQEPEFTAPGVVAEAADLEELLKKRGMGQEEVMKSGWGKILPAFASAAQGGMDRKKKAIEQRDTKLQEMEARLAKVNQGIAGARPLLAQYQARFRQYTAGEEPESERDQQQIFFGGALLEDLAGKDAKIEARYQDAMRRIADMEANMAAVMWRTFDYIAELIKIMNQRLMVLEEKMGSTVVQNDKAMGLESAAENTAGDQGGMAADEALMDDEEMSLEDE